MRIKLTPATVAKLATPGVYWDEAMAGFGVVVTPALHKSFCVQYRNATGVSRRATLKLVLGLEKARREAQIIQGRVAQGLDPVAEKRAARQVVKTTLAAIFADYERIEGGKLRSAAARRALFSRHVLPALGNRPVKEIRRGEIVALLDDIQAATGVRTANICLMILRRVMSWHSVRDEHFTNPIVKGMARQEAPARDRILTDDEVRALWAATADQADPFNRLMRFTLLTACRRDESGAMRWQEIKGAEWSIPSSRYKTGIEMLVPLSSAPQAVLASSPKIGNEGWVFTIDGKTRIGSFSRRKAALDKRMVGELRAAGVEEAAAWRTHDLRRTARSLMSRAGVPADHAERALGHKMAAIRGTYDRHSYAAEKAQAFEALAGMVERILSPADNVVTMRAGKVG
jgi:integrase